MRAYFTSIFLLLSLPLFAQQQHPQEIREVRIIVHGQQEALMAAPHLFAFRNTQTNRDYANQFTFDGFNDPHTEVRLIAKHIPYGTYQIRIAITANRPELTRTVTVGNPSERFYFSSDFSNAHIMLVDDKGATIDKFHISQVIDENGTEYTNLFEKSSSAVLPVGVYTVSATAPQASGSLKICFCQPDTWAIIGESSTPGRSSVLNFHVHGTINVTGSAAESKKPIMLSFLSVNTSESISTVVMPGSNVAFHIDGVMPGGNYVMTATFDGKALLTENLTLPITTGSAHASARDGDSIFTLTINPETPPTN